MKEYVKGRCRVCTTPFTVEIEDGETRPKSSVAGICSAVFLFIIMMLFGLIVSGMLQISFVSRQWRLPRQFHKLLRVQKSTSQPSLTRSQFLNVADESSIPDWRQWKCQEPKVSYDIIGVYYCDELDDARLKIQLKGYDRPFLLGWGRNDSPDNGQVALYIRGRGWIIGARSKKFVVLHSMISLLFLIFNEQGDIRMWVEVQLPQKYWEMRQEPKKEERKIPTKRFF